MFDSIQRQHVSSSALRARGQTEVFLLGQVDFELCLALQERLLFDQCSRADGRITVLVCEHPQVITIGRGGSRSDVRLRGVNLAGRNVEIVRVNRGGGTMLHLPGQLAVYPLVPLDWHGWTVGEFLYRFQDGLYDALSELGIAGQTRPQRYGVWGESGQLVSMGIAIKHWVTYFGALVHVSPALPLFQYVETDPLEHTRVGSLYAERKRPVRMSSVRSRVVRAVADALGSRQYHLYSGHPLLSHLAQHRRGVARAT